MVFEIATMGFDPRAARTSAATSGTRLTRPPGLSMSMRIDPTSSSSTAERKSSRNVSRPPPPPNRRLRKEARGVMTPRRGTTATALARRVLREPPTRATTASAAAWRARACWASRLAMTSRSTVASAAGAERCSGQRRRISARTRGTIAHEPCGIASRVGSGAARRFGMSSGLLGRFGVRTGRARGARQVSLGDRARRAAVAGGEGEHGVGDARAGDLQQVPQVTLWQASDERGRLLHVAVGRLRARQPHGLQVVRRVQRQAGFGQVEGGRFSTCRASSMVRMPWVIWSASAWERCSRLPLRTSPRSNSTQMSPRSVGSCAMSCASSVSSINVSHGPRTVT